MKTQGDIDSSARSAAIFCFERIYDGVENSFQLNQVTLEWLALTFKA